MIMLTWNEVVVVVDNVIEMRWCLCWEWYWNEMLMMLEMHWDNACCVCSWGVHWPCRMSLVGENKVVKEFKHLWGDGLGSLIHPWSVYLMVPTFIRCMCVCTWGVHWPCRMSLVGEIEWLKSLSISCEGWLGIFNLSMVSALDGAMFHTLHVVYVHGGCLDLIGCLWWEK